MDLRNYLENENYIVVFDTSFLQNVYHYSPVFSEFAINCLTAMED